MLRPTLSTPCFSKYRRFQLRIDPTPPLKRAASPLRVSPGWTVPGVVTVPVMALRTNRDIAATAAILAAGLVGVAAVGSDEYVALAAVLAFMAAGFLILARIIGLGFLADFLSRTVLVGFLTGVGIQVAFGEISGMLGLKGGGHGTLGKILADPDRQARRSD